MVDQIRFFATAARHLEGKSAGEYMAGHTSFDPARAGRRLRPGRPVELPDDDGGLEVRPGDRRRQHRRAQAERHDAGEHDAARRDRRRVPAAGRVQRRSAATATPAGRWSSTTSPTWCRSPARCAPAWRSPASAAADLKRVHLELGGKAPVVVFDDADIDAAVEGISVAGYFNAGQDCTAATRVLAGPGVYGDFADALAEAAKGDEDRPARRRRRALRPGQQPEPARAGQRVRRAGAGPRPRARRRRAPGRHRVLLRADRRRRPAPGRRDDPGRDLRPGHHRAALQRRGRGRALGQRRPVRAGVERVDEGRRAGDADGQAPRLRLRVDQHPHPARRRDAPRRLQALRLRQGPLASTASTTTPASST